HRPGPSFDLARGLLPEPAGAAATPVGRLRRWRLWDLAGSGGPLQARLVVDERILHQVIGLSYPDPRLEPWFRPLEAATVVAVDEDVRALAEQWQGAADLARAPLARLEQGDGEAFAKALAAQLELRLYHLQGELPSGREEREQLARLWEREALLRNAVLWIEIERPEAAQARRLGEFLDNLQGLVLLSGEGDLRLRRRQWRVQWGGGDAGSREALWQQALGEQGAALNGKLGAIAEQFQLPAASIVRIAADWRGSAEQLWDACRLE